MKTLGRKLAVLLAAIACMGYLAACNTTEGVGRDVEELGDEIQDAAD